MSPVLVIGTPRSRTAWLSAYLTTPDRIFLHEPSGDFTGLDDLRRFLANDNAAACDSVLTLFWRQIVEMREDVRFVVVTRDVVDVEASSRRAGHTPWNDGAWALTRLVKREAGFASRRSGSVTTTFDDLVHDGICNSLYYWVHGRLPPPGWTQHWQSLNVQRPWREPSAGALRFLAECRALA